MGYCEKSVGRKNINYVFYRDIAPNQPLDQIDEAAEIASDFGVTAVIVIVGISSVDAAKSTALLIANKVKTARDIYEFRFLPKRPARLLQQI